MIMFKSYWIENWSFFAGRRFIHDWTMKLKMYTYERYLVNVPGVHGIEMFGDNIKKYTKKNQKPRTHLVRELVIKLRD